MSVPAAVASLRAYAERGMTDRCTIERDQGDDRDPRGGTTPDWQPHLQGQPCKIWVEAGRTAVTEDRSALIADWSMGLPIGTDIAAGDRLTTAADAAGDTIVDAHLYIDHVSYKRDQLVCSLERRGDRNG